MDWTKYIYHPENEDELWYEASFPLENKDIYFDKEKEKDNSIGFIGDEFSSSAEMVALGCSITYGIGVSENQIWSNKIAKELNIKCNNISGPGRSVPWIISNFFSYVEKFGNPKVVVALFPNFTRMQVTSRHSEIIPESQVFFNDNQKVIRYKIHRLKGYEGSKKYFKKPFIAEEIMPLEMAFDLSIQYIKMLELYCNSNNIKLIWSTWVPEQEDWLDKNINKTKFKNYISVGMKYWHNKKVDGYNEKLCKKLIEYYHSDDFNNLRMDNIIMIATYNMGPCDISDQCESYVDCHSDYKNEKYFSRSWDSGETHGHPAAHRHIHIYEAFLKGINEYNIRN
jgi:hypothetical protein